MAARGVFEPGRQTETRELAGGVSNVVLAVRQGDRGVIVKQALPRLRVKDEWLAKRERAITEGEALRVAGRIAGGYVPDVLDIDHHACALTISKAPDGWTNWKDRLLSGTIDASIAARLGEFLAEWHARTSDDAEVARRFRDFDAFNQLRVEPYYDTVRRRHPELAADVIRFVRRMKNTHLCLVHGDYSPKNVLVGKGFWVIDFEVAHYGDPAFDVAFMLHHLLLKRVHLPQAGCEIELCIESFWRSYARRMPAELLPSAAYVLGHVGCLMVARVDGKSPAEYLSPSDREAVRDIGTRLLLGPPSTVSEALATSLSGLGTS